MFFCGNKNTDELCVIPNAGAKEAWELISEHYIMMSLIRLLDAMVGNEPFIDFKEKTYEGSIQKIKDELESYRNNSLHVTSTATSDVFKLRELLSLTTSKWHQLQQTCKE